MRQSGNNGRQSNQTIPTAQEDFTAIATHVQSTSVAKARQHTPVRQPAKRRSSSCTTGHLPTNVPDSEAPLQSEGRLDFDFQFIMAVSPHVLEYVEQPETFRWHDGERWRSYTPDGFARTTVGPIYFEIKPKDRLARSPDLKGKHDEIIVQCARRGASFSILTEENIKNGDLLENSIRVWSASQEYDDGAIVRACGKLEHLTFPCTLGDVRDALGEEGVRMANALIGLRYLAIDLNVLIERESPVGIGLRTWP